MTVYQHTLPFAGDAFDIFRIFKGQPHAFFLDSSLKRTSEEFSYIGCSPFTTLKTKDISVLKREYEKYRFAPLGQGRSCANLSFPAGVAGYFGYDGSIFFGFYDTILAIDHRRERLIISSLSKGPIKDVLKLVQNNLNISFPRRGSTIKGEDSRMPALEFKSNFTKAGYINAVRGALEHIRRGDIYQINLSHQIKVSLPRWQQWASAAGIYKILRQSFPSEFGAYFDDGHQVVLSASPERFLKLHQGLVQVKPMKGTRPRGNTRIQDRKYKNQLIKSPKEIAELLMVTDLERNDLGRVCDYASIKVKAMRTIETYASVFQATSTIEGRLCEDCDQFDLLKAAFPSGSVTGCPKIEAMKIIKEIETVPRGLYTGALGYMSFTGNMDFNVMIRSMFLHRDQITFHVGGGIVADSKPAQEWQETWDKARAMIDTLNKTFDPACPAGKIIKGA